MRALPTPPARRPDDELLRDVLGGLEPRVAVLVPRHPAHADSPLEANLIAAQLATPAGAEGHGQARGGRGADSERCVAQPSIRERRKIDPLAQLTCLEY